MFNSLKSVVLSAAIGLGAITGAPAVASAEGMYFQLGIDDGYEQVQDGYSQRRQGRRYEEFRRCTPERAAYKARRMGLRNVRVVDVNRRTITVRGRAYGDRQLVRFGHAPNCPVIARY